MPGPEDVSPTLRALIARPDLHLRALHASEDSLDRQIRWVHSTDLADPTPFLAEDLVLLTTGTQFAGEGEDPRRVRAYVKRLLSRGVIALGFGTQVVRAGVPEALVAACETAGLALFEVPYHTPFIAVARANAEAVAAQAYARRSWALAAQRAISLAALRPDGLSATLAELARQLETWVGLYDAAGALTREFPPGELSDDAHAQLEREVAHVLRRGARAASALSVHGAPFTLQTLGRGGHLRGVIAIASGELDQEGRSVLTSVIAMAGLALEQHQSLARARAALRTGLIDALAAGQVSLARRVARSIGETIPPQPLTVALADVGGQLDAATEWLELQAAERSGSVFFGGTDAGLVLLVRAGSDRVLADFADRFDVHVGHSDPCTYDEFREAMTQASLAREHGRRGVTSFADTRAGGVLATLTDESRIVADAVLAPLRRHDAESDTPLMETLRAFLEQDGSHEATAAALGVHRHTVRARVQVAERVLGVNLRSFPERAEIWAAFVAAEA